jgi:hypothetical protein
MKSFAVSFYARKYYDRKAFLDRTLAQSAWSTLDKFHRLRTGAAWRGGNQL